MEEKKMMPCSFIAGILFAVLALRTLVYEVFIHSYIYDFKTSLLLFAAYAAFSVLLILKKREKYAIIPCAVLILVQIIFCADWFGNSASEFLYLTAKDVYRARIYHSLYLLAYICLIIIMAKGFSSNAQEKKCNFWFLPAALMGAAFIVNVVRGSWDFFSLLIIAAVIFTALWVVYPERDKDVITLGKPAARPAGTTNAASVVNDEAYCDLIKHVLLLLFTFGVWYFIWIYRMTGYTNTVRDEEERNPTNKLLLCLFVPFYGIYWTYKTAQRVDKIAAEKNATSDLATLCLVLDIFAPIIPPILMQDKINKVITAGDVQKESKTVRSEAKKEETEVGSADEIKKFKELLDMGAITQEEFDAKKNQLLGL